MEVVPTSSRSQHVGLLDVRKHDRQEAMSGVDPARGWSRNVQVFVHARDASRRRCVDDSRWERSGSALVVVNRQRDLFEVVTTLHPSSSFANLLYRRQKQTDQNGNNRDDNQKFDQREGTPILT